MPHTWQRVRRWVARALTEVLAPAPTMGALLLAIGWHSTSTAIEALKWALLAIVFASVVPLLYILRGVRAGRFTDHHVRERSQRRVPLLAAAASVLVGLALLVGTGAPREVVALIAAGAVGLGVAMAITHFWKISIHAAVTAGAVAVLTLTFGPALLALAPLVALAAWSRVEVQDHTPAQVTAGAGVGALVAAVAYSLFR